MKAIVIYDIESDKVRNKVLETCKDYGLQHIQYSAFFGELNTNQREELCYRFQRILGKNIGRVYLFPICEKDLRLAMRVVTTPEMLLDGGTD